MCLCFPKSLLVPDYRRQKHTPVSDGTVGNETAGAAFCLFFLSLALFIALFFFLQAAFDLQVEEGRFTS